MKRKIISFVLVIGLFFNNISFSYGEEKQERYAPAVVVVAPEIVATIGTFLVASGCSIISQKMLNDVTRKFYNDNEDKWDEVVKTFKSSVKKVGNGMVSIGSAFLQLLSKSFDTSIDFSDNGGIYTYSGFFGDIPIVPNETDMNFKYDPTFGYAVTGDFEIGPFKFIKNGDSLDFYYEGTYRSTCSNFFSANRRLFVKSNYLIAYHNAGSFWGNTYWWVDLSRYNYTDYTLDMPLGYSKDKLKVDEEDGKLEVGIPGTLDQLVDGSVNYDNVYNPNYDTTTNGNVGVGSLPGVSNPSIEYGESITIENAGVNEGVGEGEGEGVGEGNGSLIPSFPSFGDSLDFSPMYMTNIKDKFPFSLPWDFKNLINMFDVTPVAPKFDIPLLGQNISLDFSYFEEWATIIRFFISISFTATLIFISTKLKG